VVQDDHGQDLFLDPDASFAAAQSMGRDTGDPLAVQPKTLHRRLAQAGLLQSVDEARGRLTVRRTLGGARRYVLHLSASVLEGAVQPVHPEPEPARSRAVPWADVVASVAANGPQDASETAPAERRSIPIGPIGPIGLFVVERDEPLVAADSGVSMPAEDPVLSEDQLIGLVRDRFSVGLSDHRPVRISAGEKIVDLPLAAERWLAELDHPGWIGSTARGKLVLLGRALQDDGAGA
jgi:hypothetical protein